MVKNWPIAVVSATALDVLPAVAQPFRTETGDVVIDAQERKRR
jgi:hypothetical protein